MAIGLLLLGSAHAQVTTCITPSTTGAQIFPNNQQRNYLQVCDNDPSVLAYVCIGGTAAGCTPGTGIPIQPGGGCWEPPCVQPHVAGMACNLTAAVFGVFASSSSNDICAIQN